MKIFEESIRRLIGRKPETDDWAPTEVLKGRDKFLADDRPENVLIQTAIFERGINYDEIEEKAEYLRRRKIISLQE